MNKQWSVVAATAGILAAGTWAFAFTSGPSVSSGTNPLRTFTTSLQAPATGTTAKQDVFEVPPGQTLVVTDVRRFGLPVSN
jgi:hypothetical protein